MAKPSGVPMTTVRSGRDTTRGTEKKTRLPRLMSSAVALARAGVLSVGAINAAHAAVVTVPNGTNLGSQVPANGDIWNLLGNGSLYGSSTSTAVALPTGTSGLTINGVTSGSVITLNNGSVNYGYFSGSGATLNLSNVTLTGGNQTNGGAIRDSGNLTINTAGTVALSGNTATGGDGGAINAGGSVTLGTAGSTVTLSGNTSTANAGGVIFAGGDVTVTGAIVSVTGNTAGSDGGAIGAVGSVTLGDAGSTVTLTNNTATGGAGGAVHAVQSVTVTGNVTATDNHAGGSGGAIEAANGSVNVNGDLTASGNSAGGYGGVIQAGGAVTVTGNVISMTGNTAGNSGSGINADGSVMLGNAGSTVTLSNNTATSGDGGAIRSVQSVTVNGDLTADINGAGGFGGAIRAGGNVAATGDVISLTGNTAGLGGGAIYSVGSATLGNAGSTVTLSNNTTKGGDGGAINAGGDVTVTGDVISMTGNKAESDGGAVFASGNVTLGNATSTVTLLNNTATTDAGGAIVAMGDLVVSGQVINLTGNTSGTEGGAISAWGSVTLGDAGSTVTLANNTALVNTGGAIHAVENVTVNGDVTATGNHAAGSGGAIEAANGSVKVNGDLTASGNSTDGYGGVIRAGGAVTITGSVISMTTNAAGNGGGGINADGSVTLGNAASTVTLSENTTSGGDGGAIRASKDITVNGNSSASGNRAGNNGGAIYADGSVTLGNAGSAVTLSNNTATADAGGAVFAGGNVTVTGDVISVTGNTAGSDGGAINAIGNVTLGNAGSTVTLSNNTATNISGGAIHAVQNVTVTGDVTATGNHAGGTGGVIDARDGSVTVNGDLTASGNGANSNGGVIQTGGDVTVTGNAISLTGNTAGNDGGVINAVGNVTLGNAGSAVTLSNDTAATGDGGAIRAGQSVTVNGALTASGNTAGGDGGAIYAAGDVTIGHAGNVLTLTGNRAGADGGAIWAGGNVTLTGTTISNNAATGNGGAIDAAGDFTLNTTASDTISNNTAGGNGGAIWAGGKVTLNAVNGGITFSGNTQGSGANAIWMDNTSGASSTPATLTLNAAGYPITFYDPLQNNAANGLISVVVTGGNTVTFDGSRYSSAADQWSLVYGDTEVQSGTTLAVQNNAVYGALAADVSQSVPSSFTVDAGATLDGGIVGTVRSDNFTLGGTLNIAGRAAAGTSSGGYSTFNVVSSNVSLASGSRVLFNTYLNDASVQRTDLLTLNLNGGATSGTASVLVSNTGGSGAQTQGDGIELVRTVNGSSANAFTLGRPVEAGAYQYLLYQGGVGANAGNGNWYLRSYLEESGAGGEESGGAEPEGPVAWRPGVAAYTLTPMLNLNYGFSTLGTLHQRVGDVPGAIDPQQNTASNGVWARVDGQSFDADAGRFSTNSMTWFAQFGKDWTRDQPADGGSTHAGVTATIGNTSATFDDPLRAIAGLDTQTGTVSTQTWSLGGYWTRYLKDGTYFDSVGQVTYYHNRYGGPDGSPSQNGVGFVLSQEVGRPFQIGSTQIAIEPQAQLMYQYLSLNGFGDAVSEVSGTHTNALRGRVGLRIFGADLPNSDSHDPQSWAKPYLTFDVLHDFLRPGQTVVGGSPFNSTFSRTWFDVGAGITAAAGKHGELYGHGGYQHNFGSGNSEGWYGQIAYRYMW